MQTYFRQSEQLKTGLKIAVDRIEADDGAALARRRHHDPAARRRGAATSGATSGGGGLAAHHAAARHRHRAPSWWTRTCRPSGCCCTCSTRRACACSRRSRCASAAAAAGSGSRPCCAGFPEHELDDMKDDDGDVVVTCQFCNVGLPLRRRAAGAAARPAALSGPTGDGRCALLLVVATALLWRLRQRLRDLRAAAARLQRSPAAAPRGRARHRSTACIGPPARRRTSITRCR